MNYGLSTASGVCWFIKAKKTLVENPLKKCSGLNQVRLNPNINHKIKYKIKKYCGFY